MAQADIEDVAQRLQSTAAQNYDRIRADQKLSPQGQRQQLAKTYLQLVSGLGQLATHQLDSREARRIALTRKLFGPPGSIEGDAHVAISARDATDRVAALFDLSPTAMYPAAEQLMDRALTIGDETLARALLQVAMVQAAADRRWRPVVDVYLARHPEVVPDLQEWANLDDVDYRSRFRNAHATFHAPRPAELSGLGENQIQQIADEGDL